MPDAWRKNTLQPRMCLPLCKAPGDEFKRWYETEPYIDI